MIHRKAKVHSPIIASPPSEKFLVLPERPNSPDNNASAVEDLFEGPSSVKTTSRRASADHRSTSRTEIVTASSKGLDLQNSMLLSPPPEKARAPPNTSGRHDGNASTAQELFEQHAWFGGQLFPCSMSKRLSKRLRVVNMSSDESDTVSIKVQVSSTSRKDVLARKDETEDALALIVSVAETGKGTY